MAGAIDWVLPIGLLLATQTASATCMCRCVEGVARTVCTTLDEAAANPQLCAPSEWRGDCPAAPAGFEPERFAPPAPGAHDCREARLWDPETGAYTTTTKVCDTVRAGDARP